MKRSEIEKVSAVAERARAASRALATSGTEARNSALRRMADALEERAAEILAENEKDLAAGRERKLTPAMLDRLALSESRIEGIAGGLREVAALPDPLGEVVWGRRLANGLDIRQVRTPLGVILMVFEARPNVTADAAGLCLKAGSAVILRGGSEALHSNAVLVGILARAVASAGLPAEAVQMVPTQDHAAVTALLKLNQYIDLVIPRGGEGLIRNVVENSTIPVIKHFRGLTHVYIDRTADPRKAVDITVNAKTQRASTCNALETLLVHSDVAGEVLPPLVKELRKAKVEVRGDAGVSQAVPDVAEATEEDWATEYLDLILSIKTVDSLDEAIEHIHTYSSGLTEAIVTEDMDAGRAFLDRVDSAAVYVNASTRFTDGAEFGLGAEIGITTDKVFPRGPMGLREITSTKYVIWGSGQVRA